MVQSFRITVIGVGNAFRHDDGIGPAVVQRLRERALGRPLPPSVRLADCDGDPGRLIALWEGMELAVLIDAAHAEPGRPGRVHRIDLSAASLPTPTSSHGLGLGEAVQLSEALGRLPGRLIVLAVEGADHSIGTGLSPAVAATVGPLAHVVEAEIVRHRDAAARGLFGSDGQAQEV
ncbi:hydrogenase maturation protease [Streptomyces purpurogeneiscleroticus]|uniref:hydrogenase maturation protease n=1 Tax=Streptomyces purpurogeneiscleroticus TaxID=68259 RepID=UPI001CBBDC52|nr:hydrogenase maturation protease [Streptomyces purpurogeneiscleroticus]MBZ4018746.1 peptidase M52 [Streptomyces purpurogeneiscleroticus]